MMTTNIRIVLVSFTAVILSSNAQNNLLTVSTHDITVIVHESEKFTLKFNGELKDNINVTFNKEHAELIDLIPSTIILEPNENPVENSTVEIFGRSPGHLKVTASISPASIQNDVIIHVTVANSWPITYISIIFGWIYFLAWSISFYPQIYENFRRKSVVGLNFDFLTLNIIGFTLYTIFNTVLFWNTEIQQEYSRRFPGGLNPVLINDIFFSIHAMFATTITIIQCFIYERGDQRVSLTARGILGIFGAILIIFMGLSAFSVLHWLDFLYVCSYVKLAITLIKYIPQATMNYKRKSTQGWSIGNIILDFTGGMLSMLQMILNGYNYDDWDSIFGDATKFGLGLFSVCFDIFFILQHYVFYRNSPKELSESETTTCEDLQNPSITKY